MYSYSAKVVKVLDGDTIVLDIDLGFNIIRHGETVRMYGVNTREKTSKIEEEKTLALKAKARVEQLCPIGSLVELHTVKDKKEKYGRYLGMIFPANSDVEVGQTLINEGLAVQYFGEKRQ